MSKSGESNGCGCISIPSTIIVALIGIVGVLGAAIINNPDSLCKFGIGTCDSSESTSGSGTANALRIQAESHDHQSQQFSNEPSYDPAGGGSCLGFINDGSWVGYSNIDFGSGNWDTFRARAASDMTGGTISVKLGSRTGRTISTCAVSNTGGWAQWQSVDCPLERGIEGPHDVYLVFNGSSPWLINLNWFEFRN